jgi:hypothetical protein
MRSIELPELKFNNWKSWDEREVIENCEYPGVYLIAISDEELRGKKVRWKHVSYIGMSNSVSGLKGRWNQFQKSIIGKRGHSGGNKVFSQLNHYEQWRKKLFVSAMPIVCDVKDPTPNDQIKMGWVTFLEYEAFSKYNSSVSERTKPPFNTK